MIRANFARTDSIGCLQLSVRIGSELNLDEMTLARLGIAARLFDLGMLALPESIRKSRERLAPEEWLEMKRDTLAAKQMLGGTHYPAVEMASDIALGHHERWDAAGYPFGLKGSETPLVARIVAVAQFYNALLTEKPYRPAMPPQEACREAERQAGYAFDPQVVAAFLQALEHPRSDAQDPIESIAV